MTATVFLSYRRQDSAGHAGRIYDGLVTSLGTDAVFMDLYAIPHGDDFRDAIRGALAACDVVIAVMGESWVTATDRHGRRRLDDEDDFVRIELELALELGIKVIPVLVQGAAMPEESTLPPSLAELSYRNALDLSDRRWAADFRALVDAMPGGAQGTLPLAADSAPTGTVTLLFTDVEGSTRLWERDERAMDVAMRRHNEILRDAIRVHGGHVFKTVGDEFCVAYSTARSAIESAVAAQLALGEAEWPTDRPVRVRMGLHTGACHEVEGDYFGPTVNRVARLMSAGHGGQVLVSDLTAALLGRSLPDSTQLVSLGRHQLKDLPSDEEVYQLNFDGLATSFPLLRGVEAPRVLHNPPPALTPLVGRTAEVALVRGLLVETRVVTLAGPGGAGKTRLSVAVAESSIGEFEAAWFIELAHLTTNADLAAEVATVLGIDEEPERSSVQSIAALLADRRVLIVLDNCEHVVEGCASLVRELLKTCSRLSILATSRERRGVPGEQVYRVPPLALPQDGASIAQLMECDSAQLLVARAKAGDPAFDLDESNASTIVAICRHLDGIPLAIELVAARLALMSPEEVERRLKDRFRLLTGSDRGVVQRQSTLEASIDWSYDLLSPAQQALLCRLSVFVGTFELGAVEAVTAGGDVASDAVLTLVTELVDRSLVQVVSSAGQRRLHLGETLQEYAARRLVASGADPAGGLRRRHAAHFAGIACAWLGVPGPEGEPVPEQPPTPPALRADAGNLRAALETLLASGAPPDVVIPLATAVAKISFERGRFGEGLALLDRALAAGEPTSLVVQSLALRQAAWLLAPLGRLHEAEQRAGDAWKLAVRADEFNEAMEVVEVRAFLAHQRGDHQAVRRAVDEGVGLAETSRDPLDVARALHQRAKFMSHEDLDQAVADLGSALATFAERGEHKRYWHCLHDLALAELEAGTHDAARAHFEELLDSELATEVPEVRGVVHMNLGELFLLVADTAAAIQHWEKGVTWITESDNQLYLPACILLGALCCSATGELSTAAEMHGATKASADRNGLQFGPFEEELRENDINRLRDALGAGAFDRAFEAGSLLGASAAIAVARTTLDV